MDKCEVTLVCDDQVTEAEPEAFHIDLDNKALKNTDNHTDRTDASDEAQMCILAHSVWTRPERNSGNRLTHFCFTAFLFISVNKTDLISLH